MTLFWEFFLFELKYRVKSLSTWVYFGLWFLLSFLTIAAEDFISTGNGKQLLNGPYSTTILYIFFMLFGTIFIIIRLFAIQQIAPVRANPRAPFRADFSIGIILGKVFNDPASSFRRNVSCVRIYPGFI